MKPKICVSVTGKNFREIKELIKITERNQPDLVEIRFDYLTEKIDTLKIRNLTKKPLIATNRPTREGGLFDQPESLRIETLASAARNGFDYIDIELSTPKLSEVVKGFKRENCKILVSFHDCVGTPPIHRFFKIMEKQIAVGADLCKIISTAKNIEDNIIPLTFIAKTSKNKNIISFCMGNLGKLSRLLSPIVGGVFTYASVKSGRETAPGQMSIKTIRRIYKLINP